MDTKTGEIRTLTDGESLREREVEISEREAAMLATITAEERNAVLAFHRQQEQVQQEQKPKTKKARTSGFRRSNGDNPNRGKKKGRRG